jgi:hypothetical protein
MNNAIKWIKFGLGAIAGLGASTIVGNVVKNAVDTSKMNLPQRLAVVLGSSVLGMMVGDAADKYICKNIDDIWDGVQTVQKLMTENTEDEKTEAEENG